MKKRILYVEDEPFLARIVKETLEMKDYEIVHNKDGARILEAIQAFNPDICVLDVMLPNIDGFTLGSMIRNVYPRLPILFLTAKSQTEDVLRGFSSGGTDYLKKPFSMEELMVRIDNQLRLLHAVQTSVSATDDVILLGDYEFIPGKYELKNGSRPAIKLSSRECEVLLYLCKHKNQVSDRRQLLHAVWGDDSFFNSRNLDVYIRKLREYLSIDPRLEIITLKGKGYHFSVPIQNS